MMTLGIHVRLCITELYILGKSPLALMTKNCQKCPPKWGVFQLFQKKKTPVIVAKNVFKEKLTLYKLPINENCFFLEI